MNRGESPQRAESAAPQARGLTGSSKRILVVDDDAGMRQFTAEVLSGSGYQTETAEDGAAAWEALQASRQPRFYRGDEFDLQSARFLDPRPGGIPDHGEPSREITASPVVRALRPGWRKGRRRR